MTTPPPIDSLIGHRLPMHLKCCAVTLKGVCCKNPVSKKNNEEASVHLISASLLQYAQSDEPADLTWLAGLLLCQRNHQGEAHEVAQIWQDQVYDCLESQTPPQVTKVPRQKRDSTDKGTNRSRKADSCPDRRIIDVEESAPTTRRAMRTRSMGIQTSSEPSNDADSLPKFFNYRVPRRNLPAVNADVMKIILNTGKPNERLSAQDMKDGHIYAYTRSSNPGYVKIGLTEKTPLERLHVAQRDCNCTLQLETTPEGRRIPHVYQIERLIHAELALYRRRERRCNNGAGCPTKKHKEWFEVGVDLALEVINRWCSWAEKKPYDDDGVLREEWRVHTKVSVRAATIDEQDQGDRWQEWIDSFPTSSSAQEVDEPLKIVSGNKQNVKKPKEAKAEKSTSLISTSHSVRKVDEPLKTVSGNKQNVKKPKKPKAEDTTSSTSSMITLIEHACNPPALSRHSYSRGLCQTSISILR